jgi:peroxiredoxin
MGFEARLDQATNHFSMEDTMQSLSGRPLEIGHEAPDFRLYVVPDQLLSLAELRGRPVVLVFYAADWSPICADQIALYSELLDEFAEYDAQLLGVSVDGPWCHAAFRQDRKIRFPLLSDFEPKGAVARLYGVYQPDLGVAERALYVIDSEGVIRWSHISPMGINPGADGILGALEGLPDMPARGRP